MLNHSVPDPIRQIKFKTPDQSWSVDRIGRLLAGSSILLYISLWLLLPPSLQWIAGLFLIMAGAQLVITSLTGWCPLNKALRKVGAKEREEIFWEQLEEQFITEIQHGLPEPSKHKREKKNKNVSILTRTNG